MVPFFVDVVVPMNLALFKDFDPRDSDARVDQLLSNFLSAKSENVLTKCIPHHDAWSQRGERYVNICFERIIVDLIQYTRCDQRLK